jgi:hypothetical protein
MKLDNILRITRKLTVILVFTSILSFTVQNENASGTLTYKTAKQAFKVPLKFAHFVTGPDAFDAKKKIRRLVFTGKDLEAKIKACGAMNCIDPSIEGIQVDLDAAPRILYWVNLNNQMVHYSGTAGNDILSLQTESADRITGTINLDQSASGGPALQVKFDAALLKNFTKAQ